MTTVTVYRRDNGETAVALTGELVSEDSTADLIRVTVMTAEFGEQFVEYDDEEFTHRLDEPSEA